MKGRIKFYNEDKRFGFIATQEGDYFFHVSEFGQHDLQPSAGSYVEFTPSSNRRGPMAKAISFLEVEERYDLPRNFLSFPDLPKGGWEVLAPLNCTVYAGHRNPEIARRKLEERARKIGANALYNVRFEKVRKSEASHTASFSTRGGGIHHYTYHKFSGVPALLGREAIDGEVARSELDRTAIRQRIRSMRRRLFYRRLLSIPVIMIAVVAAGIGASALLEHPAGMLAGPIVGVLAVKVVNAHTDWLSLNTP